MFRQFTNFLTAFHLSKPMPQVLAPFRKIEMKSLDQAAEAVALAFTESTCVQISTLALLIAKRIGKTQTDATLKLGEEGFNQLIHEIKIWTSQLPTICMAKIYNANVWPHRCCNSNKEKDQSSLSIHIPGTPTGAESLTWAIYQVLCELGELLVRHGFKTNDIGTLYDHEKMPHLGILLRFPWSNEMKALFTAYGEDLEAIQKISVPASRENNEELRDRASSLWDAV